MENSINTDLKLKITPHITQLSDPNDFQWNSLKLYICTMPMVKSHMISQLCLLFSR